MEPKVPCDTRRCRKEGTHKRGMFHFCDDHYTEFCPECIKISHPDYLKIQGVEILPPAAPKKKTGIVGVDKIEPIFVPVIPMYEREG